MPRPPAAAVPVPVPLLSGEQALAAQLQVFHDTAAYVGSMSLRCAVELGIFEAVSAHGPTMTHSELISSLHPNVSPAAKSKFLGRILRLVAQMGYLTIGSSDDDVGSGGEDLEVAYSLTPLSVMLLKANLGSFALGVTDPRALRSFESLSGWLKSERPESPLQFVSGGKSVWELASDDPEFNSAFNESCACDTRVGMEVVVERCRDAFKGLRSLVDLGGGTGAAARAIAQAFPDVKCTVYDLPHVIATVPESSLVEAVHGNMFEHVPRADAIFLKEVLHGWDDADCVRILERCREAIPADGGKVIMVEMVMPGDSRREDSGELRTTQLYFDVIMMAYDYEGKERTEREWKKIFNDAGFTGHKFTPVGVRSLIEIFPSSESDRPAGLPRMLIGEEQLK